MKGTEFAKTIAKLQGSEREAAVLQAFYAGSVPGWLAREPWREVHVEADIKGKTRRLVYFVSPDYFSIGENDDFLRMPARPATYQEIATSVAAILPSRRMVNAIWGSASVRLVPNPLPGMADRKDSEPFVMINTVIDNQLHKAGAWPTNALIAGQKKDVVVGPKLDGSMVAIYGWHKPDGKPWQPYPGPHNVEHVDYSHGGRLVSRACFLDGAPRDIATVFTDPDLHVLVSDQGPFPPFFPNTGGGAVDHLAGITPTGEAPTAAAMQPQGRQWGTLEWLTAISASLGIAGFVYDRFVSSRSK